MLTTHYGKNNLFDYNPILKRYFNKYNQLFSQCNFLKTNSKYKCKKQLFIECITNDNNFVYDNKDNSDNDDNNNPHVNNNVYVILGSVFFGVTSYSLYHFFYIKK